MIPNNFQEAFSQVKTLVEIFQKDEAHYLSPKYQEAEVRQHFLDKFFVALGWDVLHQTQQNPYEREVRIEKSVIVAGRGKRADYAFYLTPNFSVSKFMVEAKKPSRQLDNPQDYFQAIRYGWNSNNPIAVLTDFEQFRILDSRYKPSIDSALSRSLKKFHYLDYSNEAKFAEIYWLFSRQAVANGSIEKYVAELPKLRGAKQAKLFATQIIQPVDESFLNELDDYREQLARAFKNKNADLSGEDLTEITQKTLDRLVFIRFLEDKLVEADEVIDNLGSKSGDAWRDFVNEAKRLDKIYNGIIFKPHSILDSPNFSPDLKAFEQIRDDLSHKNSPYDFNTIPIHILGSIYERFLGKEITVTDKRAKVEEKPEVRKAGGVYYTPEYIVKYIVENTIGKLIAGKKPEEIAKLKFADIACGSGSFLLGAFDYLIKFHTDFYNANDKRKREAIKQGIARETIDGTLQLTVHFKREILLNNIFGVDVDAQAVEVAQLSLYLKLLEEETTSTKQQYLAGFREQLLPSLDKNIICGNSLIDEDYMTGQLFDFQGLKKLRPMNYQSSFPEVFRNGGFDAIIGNPPYVRMEVFKPLKNYLKERFYSHDERSDLYAYFIEQANKLLKIGGKYGVIVSNKFLRANYGSPLRKFLEQKTNVEQIIDFAGLPVFIGATVRTIILITSPKTDVNVSTVYSPPLDFEKFKILQSGQLNLKESIEKNTYQIQNSALKKDIWSFGSSESEDLLDSLKSRFTSLKVYSEGKICRGIVSGLTEAFLISQEKRKEILEQNPEAEEIIKPFLNGRDIRHYYIEDKKQFIIYTHHGINIEKYPAVKNHLLPFREKLEKRATKQEWFELQQPQFKFAPFMDSAKIIFPDISTNCRFAFDDNRFYSSNTAYFIAKNDLYLLALLNSKLGFFYFAQTCAGLEGKGEIYLRFFGQYLEGFPIRQIDFTNQAEKEMHDKIVNLVEQMIEAKKKLAAARLDNERQLLERYCNSLDSQIDSIVYTLYGLTNEEIALVEK